MEGSQRYQRDKNERGKATVAPDFYISIKNMGQTDSALVCYKVAAGSVERESDLYNVTKMKSNIRPLYLALEDFNAASS